MEDYRFSHNMVTFNHSRKAPLHSWYPYLEGYSPEFVKGVVELYIRGAATVLDPFSGTGSTGIGAGSLGVKTYYCEVNPVLRLVSRVKAECLFLDKGGRRKLVGSMENAVRNLPGVLQHSDEDDSLLSSYDATFGRSVFFPDHNLEAILRSRKWLDSFNDDDSLIKDLLTLACISSLVEASCLKRAGDLRYRTEKELTSGILDFEKILIARLWSMISDLTTCTDRISVLPELLCDNAFDISSSKRSGFDGVITSPPYVNGTNYFRNTKLELWFLRHLLHKDDLRKYRDQALTSGINDVNKSKKCEVPAALASVIQRLDSEAYDMRIPVMVNAYFVEMEEIFRGIYSKMNRCSTIAIDIGDSIYSGVHIQTPDILENVLSEIGFVPKTRKRLRTRYSKKGRKLEQVLLIMTVGQ